MHEQIACTTYMYNIRKIEYNILRDKSPVQYICTIYEKSNITLLGITICYNCI